jgi:formylglycine-generating enzyme required for sulfatase activity
MDGELHDLLDRLDHLPDRFDDFRGLIREAIRLADQDPETALARVREVLEHVVHDAYQRLVKGPPENKPLEKRLERLVRDRLLPLHVAPHTRFIRELGNARTGRTGSNDQILNADDALVQLRPILEWYVEVVRQDAGSPMTLSDASPTSGKPPGPAGIASSVDPLEDRLGRKNAPELPLSTPKPVASPPSLSGGGRRSRRWLDAAAVIGVLLLGVIVYVAKHTGPKTTTVKLEQITNSIGMNLVRIPAGEFLMGSRPGDPAIPGTLNRATQEELESLRGPHAGDRDARFDESPQHRVRITRPFYLGTTEVNVGQFRRFVDETGYRTEAEKDGKGAWGWDEATKDIRGGSRYTWQNPGLEQTDEHPVVNVSWNDAVAFAAWLSRKEGESYRLPTEAEWEYACRAGTTTRYSSGNDPEALAAVGNTADGTLKATCPNWGFTTAPIAARDGHVYQAPVGQYLPNAWGLYDMHGNVWEWCSDWYASDYYKHSPVDDPQGAYGVSLFAPTRVLRGGSWSVEASQARSATRGDDLPERRNCGRGFRLAAD